MVCPGIGRAGVGDGEKGARGGAMFGFCFSCVASRVRIFSWSCAPARETARKGREGLNGDGLGRTGGVGQKWSGKDEAGGATHKRTHARTHALTHKGAGAPQARRPRGA